MSYTEDAERVRPSLSAMSASLQSAAARAKQFEMRKTEITMPRRAL